MHKLTLERTIVIFFFSKMLSIYTIFANFVRNYREYKKEKRPKATETTKKYNTTQVKNGKKAQTKTPQIET